MPNKSQQGSAIVVALFVVALVVIAATSMFIHLQADTHRTRLFLSSINANFYAKGSVAWAKDQLINDWKFKQSNQVIDKTPIQKPADKINGAIIQNTIEDAEGFFNVNNLTDEKHRAIFSRLLKTISPDLSNDNVQIITLATTDWITPNAKNHFDPFYAKTNPAYRAPHRLMVSASELRLVHGMTHDLFAKLSPFIIALPTTTPININSATPEIIQSLNDKMTSSSAKIIAQEARNNPFPTTTSFLNTDIAKNNSITADEITTKSDYFLLKTSVIISDQTTIIYSLLKRDTSGPESTVTLLWQTKGTL